MLDKIEINEKRKIQKNKTDKKERQNGTRKKLETDQQKRDN